MRVSTIDRTGHAYQYWDYVTIDSVTFNSPIGRQERDTMRIYGPESYPLIPSATSQILVANYGGTVIHALFNSAPSKVGADIFSLWQGNQIAVNVEWIDQNGDSRSNSYILDVTTNISNFFGLVIENGVITDITYGAYGSVQGWVGIDNFSY